MKSAYFRSFLIGVTLAIIGAFYSVAAFAGNVAIIQGGFYTPNLKTKLEAAGHVVTEINTYTTGDLDAFDAVIQDGNSFVDVDALRDFATNGGNVILIPWTAQNWSVPADMQVMGNSGGTDYSVTFPGVTVLEPSHPFLSGVTFPAAGGFNIGRVRGINFVPEATEAIANWGDANGAFLGTRTVGAGQVIHLNMHLITSDTAYLVIEQDWAINLVSNLIDGGLANTGDTARFNVTKTFSNGDTGDVEVTLTCNGGNPLVQNFTISGGDPAGVTFVVTNLPDTGANCSVTESGGNEGYTADLSACSWTGVTGGLRTCPIENVPEATTVSVDTTVDTDGDATIDPTFTTTIVCQNVSPDTGPNFGTVTVTNTDGMFEADWYADPVNGTDCTVTMVPNASAVEGDSCSFSFDIGDEEAGCDVAGTVFFEGIPTLSQYGLAIMALLMLGIGFVGFRRFV